MVPIFTNGSCLNFHLILRQVWPEGEFLFNIDHIITRIDGRCYDITGEVKDVEGYAPYRDYYRKPTMIKSFRRMFRAQFSTLPYKIH